MYSHLKDASEAWTGKVFAGSLSWFESLDNSIRCVRNESPFCQCYVDFYTEKNYLGNTEKKMLRNFNELNFLEESTFA